MFAVSFLRLLPRFIASRRRLKQRAAIAIKTCFDNDAKTANKRHLRCTEEWGRGGK